MSQEFQVGDVLENVSPFAMAKKVRVKAVNEKGFIGEVLEGQDTKTPLVVFRAGYHLYKKTLNQNN